MTLCIAALADDRRSIVMAADRMISLSFIESELDISKILPIADNWWALIAADKLSNVFPVIDGIMRDWQPSTGATIDSVANKAAEAYRQERQARVAAEHLSPRGLDLQTFLANGRQWFPELTYAQIDNALTQYDLGVLLLICGFDDGGTGHIFTVANPGVADRRDIPGFHAIGSGFYGAEYMMYYRELGYSFPAHEWLYYIYEAKAFGEQAGAVGTETELIVAQPGQPTQRIDNDGFQKTLDRLWLKHHPSVLDGRDKAALRGLLSKPASQSGASSNEA